ncbi:2Fe-2S iron-sulfur cluster binding domain-containing protein [Massilia sp. PDC64]|nr:2Fe-2S iron-sulfur cluster-binding protein [Massilia sp. PDC64]SDD75042.1 2Fe-2S iron-sulfur cluster binding domain-containing protein [Massilia sp. PDC64]
MSPHDSPVRLLVDGVAVAVPRGVTVVAALVAANALCTRRSVTGQRRFAFCGIGQCQECRVTVDGAMNQLACRTICADGMAIETGGDW